MKENSGQYNVVLLFWFCKKNAQYIFWERRLFEGVLLGCGNFHHLSKHGSSLSWPEGKKPQLLFGRCFVAKWITNASMILIQFPVGNSPHHKNRHHNWQSDCQLEHVGWGWSNYRERRTTHFCLEVALVGHGQDETQRWSWYGKFVLRCGWRKKKALPGTEANFEQKHTLRCIFVLSLLAF